MRVSDICVRVGSEARPAPDFDFISAAICGRLHFRAGHVDITATDQIKPIATTTARPIPLRTCSPTSRD